LPLGHIRFCDEHHHSDPLNDEDYSQLKKAANKVIDNLMLRINSGDFRSLIATSGSARCLARMATIARDNNHPEHNHGLILTQQEIEHFVSKFRRLTRLECSQIPGIDNRRLRTLPAAAVIICQLMKKLDIKQLVTSEYSLRDGLIIDWIIKHRPEIDLSKTVADPRRRSVLYLLQRYGGHPAHSHQVARFALQLFDATGHLHGLRITNRRLLEFSALLHDIGHHISGKDHNKHGAYLIRHSRIHGFTAPEINILADLVRYHRGPKPNSTHTHYAGLNSQDRRKVKVLAGILRLSDALDRSHEQVITDITVTTTSESIDIKVWSSAPLDLERWSFERRKTLLQSTLNLPINIEILTQSE
jgi:exopolyphosphatase/guanosine-5'-triphosphate,3'-diphosphate pyrophosphatase